MSAPDASALDLESLWDFRQPAVSEQRFMQALAVASGDDALILRTQIARSHGLRRDFARAREQLVELEPALAQAGPRARTHFWLEWGRVHVSATHPPDSRTEQAIATAREAYSQAFELARTHRFDALAVDAVHMLAFVDTEPADQLRWGERALEIALRSTEPAARRWQASLRNNLGYALHQLGRYPEALAQFEQALTLREQMGAPGPIRVAHWMIAWTLRFLGRVDEALAIQLRLADESEAAGEPDPYVFEELAHLYRARGDPEQAQRHEARHRSLSR